MLQLANIHHLKYSQISNIFLTLQWKTMSIGLYWDAIIISDKPRTHHPLNITLLDEHSKMEKSNKYLRSL